MVVILIFVFMLNTLALSDSPDTLDTPDTSDQPHVVTVIYLIHLPYNSGSYMVQQVLPLSPPAITHSDI